MNAIGDPRKVLNYSQKIRRLENNARYFRSQLFLKVLPVKISAARKTESFNMAGTSIQISSDHLTVMRMKRAGDQDLFPVSVLERNDHRFGKACGSVIMGCIRCRKPHKFRHQTLIFENHLQGPLGSFRLVRGVSGAKFLTRRHFLNGRRNIMIITSCAKKTKDVGNREVLQTEKLNPLLNFKFAQGRRNSRLGFAKRCGN
ncbi:MAG: hypothetical protein BWY42_01706 [Candidatus Omnitrophica bacterium ADurb.Bin277]|nr:MAG: hypothetical protein BWY42_01706 [Candidatus Omnitrophica bacterium ADurb.Bin277]